MGKIFRIGFIILFTVMSAGFLSMLKAAAEEGTCVLEASNKDVFVIVFDADDEGNKGPSYNDQPDEDQPLSGDVDRSCSGGETILVP